MTPSQQIDQYIEETGDWRGEMISRVREIVHELEPNIVEEWKWNSPVWSHHGMALSPGAFKSHVGLNFFQGAHLKNPHGLFNSSLDSKNARSIKLSEGDVINEPQLRDLIREALAYNAGRI